MLASYFLLGCMEGKLSSEPPQGPLSLGMDGQKDGWMVGWLAPATPHCMICLLSFWNANHRRVGTEFDAFFWVWHRTALW